MPSRWWQATHYAQAQHRRDGAEPHGQICKTCRVPGHDNISPDHCGGEKRKEPQLHRCANSALKIHPAPLSKGAENEAQCKEKHGRSQNAVAVPIHDELVRSGKQVKVPQYRVVRTIDMGDIEMCSENCRQRCKK